jgi:hypothetical protein
MSYPPGTRFVIASGVHRLQRVNPKDGMVFTGEPGAVLSGARVLTSFAREGTLWVASGQPQQGLLQPNDYPDGVVLPGYERDNHPEELFLDGRRLRHVGSKSQVTPGKWFFDYGADKIYMADDPNGHLVETSAADHAFSGSATNVVLENLTVRHYANPAHTGAIRASDGSNWTIRFVDASYNHGAGIAAGPGTHIHNSKMTYNGQLGLAGNGRYGSAMVIENNEIAYNRQLGYNWMWEGGGLKISQSSNTIFRNNWVHHNNGPGIWFDVYNRGATIQSNLVEHNTTTGIFYEISYGPARIFANTVRNNGAGQPGALGAGIRIANSNDVEVFGNAVDSNARGIMLTMNDRGSGPYGLLETANVWVHHNDIRMLTGTTGLVDETGNDAYYTSKGNVFEANIYRLDSLTAGRFSWTGRWTATSWEQWQASGNDAGGELVSNSTPALPAEARGFTQRHYGPRTAN